LTEFGLYLFHKMPPLFAKKLKNLHAEFIALY